MVLKSIITREQATKNAEKRKTKNDHAGKDWAILNTAEKFEIIGDDLRARGVID